MNKVSILISVYNGMDSLNKCFDSLYSQTSKDFEIVCIDDCSSDESLKIIEKWQKLFAPEKFKIIRNNSNLGLTRSLNKGLKSILTEYVARIDADDWWMPNKLEKQIDFMEKNKSYGIIGCFYRNIYKGKERPIKLPISNEEIKKTIIKKNPFAHSCVLFKTDLIKKAGGYNENLKYAQDYELWLRLFPLTKFYNIPEFLCYRSIEKGISKENQKDQMKLVLKTKIKYIRKYNLSPKHYIYLFDILSLILIPDTIKNLKRKLL